MRAKKVFTRTQEAKRATQWAYRGDRKTGVVGSISSSAYNLLARMMSAYRERFPHSNVALREPTAQEQLRVLEMASFSGRYHSFVPLMVSALLACYTYQSSFNRYV